MLMNRQSQELMLNNIHSVHHCYSKYIHCPYLTPATSFQTNEDCDVKFCASLSRQTTAVTLNSVCPFLENSRQLKTVTLDFVHHFLTNSRRWSYLIYQCYYSVEIIHTNILFTIISYYITFTIHCKTYALYSITQVDLKSLLRILTPDKSSHMTSISHLPLLIESEKCNENSEHEETYLVIQQQHSPSAPRFLLYLMGGMHDTQ